MVKNISFYLIIITVIVCGIFIYKFSIPKPESQEGISCTLDAKMCPDGSSVGRSGPNCEFSKCPENNEGINVNSPTIDEKLNNPLIIRGMATGPWFFEAQFTAELLDSNGEKLGTAILTAEDDWMTENFVPFEGTLNFTKPKTPAGILRFLSSNPSGLPENQKQFDVPVKF